jgi:hypothetical protein
MSLTKEDENRICGVHQHNLGGFKKYDVVRDLDVMIQG